SWREPVTPAECKPGWLQWRGPRAIHDPTNRWKKNGAATWRLFRKLWRRQVERYKSKKPWPPESSRSRSFPTTGRMWRQPSRRQQNAAGSKLDCTIVALYGQEFRGYAQYYAYAHNRHWLHRLRWAMELSMLKTLAGKHKSTVSQMARKYASVAVTDDGKMRCYRVVIERRDKPPLTAMFGGIPLKPQPFAEIHDVFADQDRCHFARTELIQRLLADECELCGSTANIAVHHVRKLADLKVEGRRERPTWVQVMASRRRKTLV